MGNNPTRPPGFDRSTPEDPHVARITIDETPVENPRLVIHVHHAGHSKGVRAFYRRRDSDVARSIRNHIRREIDADLERIELSDSVGVGIDLEDLLPETYRYPWEQTPTPSLVVSTAD